MDFAKVISGELNVPEQDVSNVITLLDEGNTLPFIARYRKESHHAMGDEKLRILEERLRYLRSLEERKDTVRKTVESQGNMTPELAKALDSAMTMTEIEDLYRPFKPKRRTRATIAKEKGLEPLADRLFSQEWSVSSPEAEAAVFVSPVKGVNTIEEALSGASDIIAEKISDMPNLRKILRSQLVREGSIVSKAATEEDTVYATYYDFRSAISRIRDHQILAVNRGEKEKALKVTVEADHDRMLAAVFRTVVRQDRNTEAFIRSAAEDAYHRLIFPALEREIRTDLTETASEGAIRQFSVNLRALLMQPPVKEKTTMGLDPGYRNGCKVAVVDPTGKVLDTAVVYPTYGEKQEGDAIRRLRIMIEKYGVAHIAIGNGTASRETESMVVKLLRELPQQGDKVSYMIVSEAGASVYSASKLAAAEFPDYDVNLRSAVSIARRMQDPLAELVKIEPKAIGVGQYQHDMPQKQLEEALDAVVEDCVNSVGVNVNTASASLLERVAGLNATTAKNVVLYREENGAYKTRNEIKKVPRLGAKAYEQCAGFLRIPAGKNVLDNTAVHPESYSAAEGLLQLCGFSDSDVRAGKIQTLKEKLEQMGAEETAKTLGIGTLTLGDIADELMKPGRDIRESLPKPIFRTDVLDMKDLKPGMVLDGTVRSVVDFGAFVDIGVHEDGLVHISQIANRFVKHPSDELRVGDVVKVMVLEVNEKKKRISLSMKQVQSAT